jgi:hypothetical protein
VQGGVPPNTALEATRANVANMRADFLLFRVVRVLVSWSAPQFRRSASLTPRVKGHLLGVPLRAMRSLTVHLIIVIHDWHLHN